VKQVEAERVETEETRAGHVGRPLYRGSRLKQMLKPLAVRLVSTFWLAVYRLRYGKRVSFGRNFITNGKLVVRGKGRVLFGDDVNAWCHAEKNVLIAFSPQARIVIGDGCRLSGAGIQANLLITIGPRCMLNSTLILDTDFHQVDPVLRHDPTAPAPCAPVTLEENVWVAGQSAILRGVTIGENSVVAFRAVVTKDVSPNVVVAGNPARIVREF
jgi:maltose O-acetyltransferase